jgi:hypothetical protein
MRGPTGDDFEDLCGIVGLMTLTWAYAENGLAIMLQTIIDATGPIKGHHQAPLSLKFKLSALKVAVRDIPALQPLHHEGRLLVMRFGQLGKRRSDFTHSAAFGLEDGGFETTIARVKRGNYEIENKRVDVRDAVLLQAEIAEFCQQVISFMARVDAAVV